MHRTRTTFSMSSTQLCARHAGVPTIVGCIYMQASCGEANTPMCGPQITPRVGSIAGSRHRWSEGETVDGDAQSCRRRIMRRLLAAERCSPIRWAADTRVKLGRLECLAEEDMLLMNHLVKRLESALIRQAVSLVEGSSCVWYRRAATQEAMPFRAPATRRHPAMAGGCASRLAVRRCSVALQRKVAGLLRAMNESCT